MIPPACDGGIKVPVSKPLDSNFGKVEEYILLVTVSGILVYTRLEFTIVVASLDVCAVVKFNWPVLWNVLFSENVYKVSAFFSDLL